ncbi:MAG TPA: MerR family transcriptional regulator [Pseudolabrys sp.]|nr:MerR family transcriptional regulator [Pseudolabrys sp.]
MDRESRNRDCADLTDSPQTVPVSEGLTIAELARDAGITVRAVRFYQAKGLLPSGRSGRGQLFDQEDRHTLAFILRGKRLGFTLAEIRDVLRARARGVPGAFPVSLKKCMEQISLLERQQAEIDAALAELRQICSELAGSPEKEHAGLSRSRTR